MSRSIKKFFLPLLLIMMLAMSGCGSDQQSSKPREVNIVILAIPNDESVARSWYADELGAALGVKTVILDYVSSVPAINAMATGNIDIAVFGSPAAAIAVSRGLDCEIIWLHDIEGDNECLVVKNNSDIESIDGLIGKRVGVPFGSTTHYALLNALANAGIETNQVKILDLQPIDLLDAWQNDQLDAAFIWQPTLERLLDDGHVLISSRDLNERGITTADVAVVSRDFARANPDIVKKYIELQMKAHNLFKTNPKQAAAFTAKNLRLTLDEARRQMDELVWLDADEQISDRYLGTAEKKGDFVDSLVETARFLEKYDLIERAASRETFENAINPEFAEAVAKKPIK